VSYENPWTYEGNVVDSEILDNYLGFVYIITNVSTQKKYIGKKLLKKTKTKQVKGKKKRSLIESDWKDYYGSNKELLEEIETQGKHNYKREILRLCKTKGECNYWEAKYQFNEGVLEHDMWYNSWIMVKVHRKHLPQE
jgi:asparagine synthetase B (glutamine-hydrolysing)